MKRVKWAVSLLALACLASPALAESVALYLDTAPNASGSPAWPAFCDAAYASIYGGTFVNQAHSFNSANVGTLKYEVQDYMVYSFGDLGKRLHAFYYVPGATTATLQGRFQVSIQYDYAGVWYNPYVEYGWPEWLQPSSWVNYDGNGDGNIDGVMGSMGNALWGAYGVNTPEALAADIADAENYLGNTRFFARLDGQVTELTALHTAVPLPAAAWAGMTLLGGLGGLRGWKRMRRQEA